MNITQAVLQIRAHYIQKKLAESYFDINNGCCEELAIDALKLVTQDRKDFMDLQGEQLMDNELGVWDWALLERYWPNVKAPEGLSQQEVDAIDFGVHIFIADHRKCRFYDAECPEGTDNLFDLPLYRRGIIEALRLKGIRTPDVITDDIIPAPLCPIPNPPAPGYNSDGPSL